MARKTGKVNPKQIEAAMTSERPVITDLRDVATGELVKQIAMAVRASDSMTLGLLVEEMDKRFQSIDTKRRRKIEDNLPGQRS
jgi:hypothetical protein